MMKNICLTFAAFLTLGITMHGAAHAQKWGNLTMTVLLDGEVPKPKTLNKAADPKCNQAPDNADDLVIDPKTKAIANIAFYIDTKKMKLEESQIHPDLRSVPRDKPILDNNNCKFTPHMLAIRAGQTLLVTNSDQTAHNAKFNFFSNTEVNPMIQPGGNKEIQTQVEEKAATKVDCNIHPWMNAFVFVLDHPYVGISDAAGKIKIENLPAGVPLEFKIWHEVQNKAIEEVTLAGKKETWKKGNVIITLKEGDNDLGTLLLKPDRFK
jgi:plastocyanin